LAVASSKLLPAVFCLLPISFYLHQNPAQKKAVDKLNLLSTAFSLLFTG